MRRRKRRSLLEKSNVKSGPFHISPEDADLTLDQWARGILLPDVLISFFKPKVACVPVRTILENRESFDGWMCHHPLEGDDYKANGKYYAKSNTIFTFGH